MGTTTAEFSSNAGLTQVGVWGDSPQIGVMGTGTAVALAAYNNSTSKPPLWIENDTTSIGASLFYAWAPKAPDGGVCQISAHADLSCSGNLRINGFSSFLSTVSIGTGASQAELTLNAGGTANQDTLLLGNNTTRGLQLRDTGDGMDIESFGVPLYFNYLTKQNLALSPNGGQVGVGTANVSGTAAPLVVGAVTAGLENLSITTLGDVNILGNLVATGVKEFRIDHPLDPENRYLRHAAIESSEVLNMYTGNVVLDGRGEARIEFPAWFGALNTDFRYQLTAVGGPAPGLYVAEEIRDNSFRIAGGTAGMKVSWQVTCVRSDEYARAHPFAAEAKKTEEERRAYLATHAH